MRDDLGVSADDGGVADPHLDVALPEVPAAVEPAPHRHMAHLQPERELHLDPGALPTTPDFIPNYG